VEQRLTLPRATVDVLRHAVIPDLSDVAHHRLPSLDLTLIVRATAPQGIAAVPPKPVARILVVDPALLAPIGERLGRVNTEEVESRISSLG